MEICTRLIYNVICVSLKIEEHDLTINKELYVYC